MESNRGNGREWSWKWIKSNWIAPKMRERANSNSKSNFHILKTNFHHFLSNFKNSQQRKCSNFDENFSSSKLKFQQEKHKTNEEIFRKILKISENPQNSRKSWKNQENLIFKQNLKLETWILWKKLKDFRKSSKVSSENQEKILSKQSFSKENEAISMQKSTKVSYCKQETKILF